MLPLSVRRAYKGPVTDRPFRIIHGTPAPDTPRERTLSRMRKMPKPEHVLRCPRCTGISVIQVKLGMSYRNGKPVGGQKQLICETCFLNGERVLVS